MEKIISELIKAVEITNWQVTYNQARVSADFEIIVTYNLYKLISLNNLLYLFDTAYDKKKFMGHNLRVTTDLDGFSFWIADRQEIKNEGSD